LIRRVIVDSSPLIILFKARLEWVLPKLFDEIIVPDTVRREIDDSLPDDPARTNLPNAAWAKYDEGSEVVPLTSLGAGESSVISSALRIGEAKVVLDDAAARNQARALGLKVIGTGGLLVLGKRSGVIDSFDDAIEAVVRSGLWINSTTVELLRRKAKD
jgi:predicted nucleic acid-binding protein